MSTSISLMKDRVIPGIAMGEFLISNPTGKEDDSKEAEALTNNRIVGCRSSLIQITCGYRHTLLLSRNGTVFATGWNRHGQCGDNDGDNNSSSEKANYNHEFIPISMPTKEVVIQIAAGFSTSYAGKT